jgi:PAS domain S-box-containing protein
VTEREQLTRQIREVNTRLVEAYEHALAKTLEAEHLAAQREATLESIAGGVIIFNPEGEVVQANAAMERMWGSGADELPRQFAERAQALQIEPADGRPFPIDELPVQRALRGETVSGVIMVFHRGDGGIGWLSASAAPIKDRDGTISGVVGTYTDINQLRELEEQRENMINTISHDLRMPLTVIRGHAQLLKRSFTKLGVSGANLENVELILTGAKRMNSMIQDLVDSARLQSGQLLLNRQQLVLPDFLSSVLRESEAAIEVERVKVEVNGDMPAILADPDRLERILLNLLSNALKYSPPETEVLLRATANNGEVTISVVDRGSGISAEELPRLFQRFFRSSKNGRSDGVGLGLHITRTLVEAHGGRIWVESEVGVGSTFYFTLPVTAPEQQSGSLLATTFAP